ncbi:TetR/AcrR family transcriptional regulator [Pseudomaricurvus sp. HS19]|uniref:TetR/AcrR family transcriptional regulator n=1 Tax=Pseudomaricurvus sp. HS19 TaxID=2692626 RepID=UPI0013717BE8|nr:TetR/AcrR family transcriptional regulator [Pseudomaricurvus sp. HS19]MYM64283.1 TetR family transcriptional regulator [Pseudomaricurvus sp. HS19]
MSRSTTTRPKAGRPTAAQAQKRHVEILDKALKVFLKKGYDLTTLDEIAASMHMTKRTIYTNYGNKEALFKTALEKAFVECAPSPEELRALITDDLATTLEAIAHNRVSHFLTPKGRSTQRIVNSETHRFPELLGVFYRLSTLPTIVVIKEVLEHHAELGDIYLERPDTTAALFLSMAVGVPARGIMTGIANNDIKDLDDHIRYCVQLFLHGLTKPEVRAKTPA